MSEQINTESEPTEGQPQEGEPKTFDAEYVDKLRKESAKYRTEAKANADAAARLATIEEANKTAEQKAAERLREAEDKAASLEFRATVAEVASDSGVPVALLTGPTDRTADGIKAYADSLQKWAGERKKQGNNSPREGTTPTSTDSPELATVRGLFGG